jgi:ribosomal protein L4
VVVVSFSDRSLVTTRKGFQDDTAARVSKGADRAHQSGRRADDRCFRGDRAEDEVVHQPLKEQTDAKKVLLISDSFDENTYKAARNVRPVLLATATDVNTEQLLAFDKILVTARRSSN